MEKYDPRIDDYIKKSAAFAQPILTHLRTLVHQAADDVLETVKWGFPHFDYKGTLCSMASFKTHCIFSFWKSPLLSDPHQLLQKESKEAMGQFGRIRSLADLPDDKILISYLQEAIALNEKGIKVSKKSPGSQTSITSPEYFLKILQEHPQAQYNFEKFSNSHRKEYIMWIEEAKTAATRDKRIKTAIEWITDGKGRNWKYERKD